MSYSQLECICNSAISDLLGNQSQYINVQGAADDNAETTSAQTNLGVYQFTSNYIII